MELVHENIQLRGVEKAAVLFLCMQEERGSSLMSDLSEDEIHLLGQIVNHYQDPADTSYDFASLLADVHEHGHDLVEAVVLLQPRDRAARVEPSGIGEDGGSAHAAPSIR